MIYFIDFEDSFTHNLLGFIVPSEEVKVLNYKHIFDIENLIGESIILGPGPGHPDQYIDFFDSTGFELDRLLKENRVLGICLGHQILLRKLYSYQVFPSEFPMHGQSVELVLDKVRSNLNLRNISTIEVQRYNSLAVSSDNPPSALIELYDENGELSLTYLENKHLTMQFHPESIGTSCSSELLEAALGFLR